MKMERMIIDTDMGFDDARALVLAMSAPATKFDILAITCVFGNCTTRQGVANASRLRRLVGRDEIPIYAGAQRPMKQYPASKHTPTACHGNDGLGDVPNIDPPLTEEDYHAAVEGVHAYEAIKKFCRQYPGEVTIVCLGPLTNIALAMCNDDTLGEDNGVGRLVIMGGALYGKGNVTPNAECNFYVDPLAADIVLKRCQRQVLIAPWDLCIPGTPCELDVSVDYERHLNSPTRRGRFFSFVGVPLMTLMRTRHEKCTYIDEIAVGAVIEPTIIKKTRSYQRARVCLCDCDGQRGQLFCESEDNEGHITFITRYDAKKLNDMMDEATNIDD